MSAPQAAYRAVTNYDGPATRKPITEGETFESHPDAEVLVAGGVLVWLGPFTEPKEGKKPAKDSDK